MITRHDGVENAAISVTGFYFLGAFHPLHACALASRCMLPSPVLSAGACDSMPD